MPAKKQKALPALKPVARRVPAPKRTRTVMKTAATVKSLRKVFADRTLFGALPGMSQWALPLLKELREE